MNARFDRTLIAPLLAPHFPDMAKATSDEWHGFLNAVTRLDIALSEPNATAFDRWREALAGIGYPVGIGAARSARAKADAERLMAHHAAHKPDLAAIAKEAPHVTAADLIEAHKKAFKP